MSRASNSNCEVMPRKTRLCPTRVKENSITHHFWFRVCKNKIVFAEYFSNPQFLPAQHSLEVDPVPKPEWLWVTLSGRSCTRGPRVTRCWWRCSLAAGEPRARPPGARCRRGQGGGRAAPQTRGHSPSDPAPAFCPSVRTSVKMKQRRP